jgi:hypothetical protein
MQRRAKMMNFRDSVARPFDPVHTNIDTRALDCRSLLSHRDCILAGYFCGATWRFAGSLSSRSNFGTTPLVHDVHFFLDFIFH